MGKTKKKLAKEAAATSNVDESDIKNKNQEALEEHDEGGTVPSPKRQKTSVCFRMPEAAAVQPVLKTAGPSKPEDTMRISDVSCHRARRGAVGPLLLAFSHAPCSPALLAAARPSCTVNTQWKGDWPNPSVELTVDGRQYRAAEAPRAFYTTYLAARCKKTGETRLWETCPVVLKPQVTYPATKNPLLLAEAQVAETYQDKMLQQKNLVKAFGRGQGAKHYEKQEAMKVDVADTSRNIAKAAGGVAASSLEATAPVQKVDIVPPRMDTAARVDQVYQLSSLLTPLELRSLGEAADRFFATECSDRQALVQLVSLKVVSKLGSELLLDCLNSSASLGHRPAAILYMEGIIRFIRLRPGELAKGPTTLQKFLPPSICKKIFDTFSVGGKTVSPELKDKAICYVMVLGLLANDFKIETIHVSESLYAKNDHLKKLVAMVGAQMSQFIILKLPLAKFDVNAVQKKRRGGRN